MTTALSAIDQQLQEDLHDRISVAVTTAIAANTSIISTNLKSFDGSSDDYFIDWWVYITDKNNAAVERQVSDYATSSGTITVRGANLTSDVAELATVEVTRYRRTDRVNSINRAVRQVFPLLHVKVDDTTLISGNWLPDASFEWWTSSTALKLYSTNTTALAKTTTGGLYRGRRGTTSAKSTVSGASGYFYIDSDSWPRLLDLMGTTVDFKCWVYPEVADDAWIRIYTLKADGTAQTLTSSTLCPAGKWTLLTLTSKALNDDLVMVSIRFGVTTNAKYAYFDNARLTSGRGVTEYLLPQPLQEGNLDQVWMQTVSYSDDAPDDLNPIRWHKMWGWRIRDDGTYKFLETPEYTTPYRFRLYGTTPLASLSAATDTLELDASPELDALVAYARYWLMKTYGKPVAAMDRGRLQEEMADAYGEYIRLVAGHRMFSESGTLKGL